MSERVDKSKLQIGTVLYHWLDDIEATVTGFDEEHIHVRFNKKWYNQIESKFRYEDIGVQLYYTKEEAIPDNYKKNMAERIRAEEEKKRLEKELAEKRRIQEEEEERKRREAIEREWEEKQAEKERERLRKEEERERERLRKEEEIYQQNQQGWKELYSYLESLEAKGASKKFEGLCHYTDLSNLEVILREGKVYSRKLAEEKEVLVTDSADKEVLGKTGTRVKSYVRMYYYPNTPTIYRMQGIHSYEAEKIPHMPSPVLIVFDPIIMSHRGVRFYSGNAASSFSHSTGNCYEAKDHFLWKEIQGRGAYPPDEGMLKPHYRNAEFHYPDEISTEYINRIIFRSRAELENAVFMLGNNPLFSVDSGMFPKCNPYTQREDYKYYTNYLVDYAFDVVEDEDNRSFLHLVMLFKNNNLEGYDKKLRLKLFGKVLYEGTDEKKIEIPQYSAMGDRHARLTYNIPIDDQDLEYFDQLELEFYLNDHRVLYNGIVDEEQD